VLCCNDAKLCYDHMVHSVGSLCFQQQGVEEPPVVCMFMTLQKLEHTIWTAYGDSEQSYGEDLWAVPIPGLAWGNKNEGPMSRLGQGNGAALTG
jgi:hypothetical protein